MNAAQAERAAKRVAHIKSHLDYKSGRDLAIRNIENNLGDPRACLSQLSGRATASAMYEWFEHRDLASTRQWFYVASRLTQKYYPMLDDTTGPRGRMLQLINPLLSNHRSMIEWFAHYDGVYDLKRVENHKTHDFHAYQAMVALRGDWNRLAERCDRVIRDPPGAADQQKYLLDHQFYLALVHRDVGKMTEVIQTLVTPKMLKSRINDDSGYMADLICTAAVIYAKIAWHHGFEVHPASPYIPEEWLPPAPLARYDDHYNFLK
jgi:hypothetical protein